MGQYPILERTSIEHAFNTLRRVIEVEFVEKCKTIDFGFDSSFTEFATWLIASGG